MMRIFRSEELADIARFTLSASGRVVTGAVMVGEMIELKAVQEARSTVEGEFGKVEVESFGQCGALYICVCRDAEFLGAGAPLLSPLDPPV